jgi:hypothetical protein
MKPAAFIAKLLSSGSKLGALDPLRGLKVKYSKNTKKTKYSTVAP